MMLRILGRVLPAAAGKTTDEMVCDVMQKFRTDPDAVSGQRPDSVVE